jgi:hypothetical protein
MIFNDYYPKLIIIGINPFEKGGFMAFKAFRLLICFTAITLGGSNAAPCQAAISDANWVSMGGMPGVDGHIFAMASDERHGFYAAGSFRLAGGVIVNNVAKWNGSSWSALGSGTNGEIVDIALDGSGNLYIAGYFDTAGGIAVNHIAKWDGTKWSALGSGITMIEKPLSFLNHVSALAIDASGNVYAGGEFDTAGGIPAANIAKWDGSAWSNLGSGVGAGTFMGSVLSLAVDGSGNLYAGGGFEMAGGITVSHIAKWNGSAWSGLGGGTDSVVLSVAADSLGNIYAGGWFTKAGAIPTHHIAKWDGASWSALGSGVDYVENYGMEKYCISIDKYGNLYMGGHLTTGDLTTNHLVKWNGKAWSTLGGGVNLVYGLHVDGSGMVYVGAYSIISQWNGSAWRQFGCYGTDSWISALAIDSADNIYAGGNFTLIGSNGAAAKGIAKWNGSAWSALDGQTAGGEPFIFSSGLALGKSGAVYATGYFGESAVHETVAKWDGATWSDIGAARGWVGSLVVDGNGNLYAGGIFDSIGGRAARSIAQWDGCSWRALGSGLRSDSQYCCVNALAIDGSGNLFVAGTFDSAGDVSANNIAKWDGHAWSALGRGVNYLWDVAISALTIDNAGNLYAGGFFDTAGGRPAKNIAKWDGHAWSALGSGIDHPVDLDGQTGVFALSVDGKGNLYVGGGFDTAGGIPAYFIAKWNGSQWSSLGSGVSGGDVAGMSQSSVFALSVDHADNLCVGGDFLSAGGKVSPYFAKCKLNCTAARPQGIINSSARHLTYDSPSGVIRLNVQSAVRMSYCIFTLNGREVYRNTVVLPQGSNSMRIKTAMLGRGAYVAQVNAEKESIRFRMTVENR